VAAREISRIRCGGWGTTPTRGLVVGGWGLGEGGVEVSSRNLQKYIAAQEAGSNRANSARVPRDPRYRRAISRRLAASDPCSARRVELRKSELACGCNHPSRDTCRRPGYRLSLSLSLSLFLSVGPRDLCSRIQV